MLRSLRTMVVTALLLLAGTARAETRNANFDIPPTGSSTVSVTIDGSGATDPIVLVLGGSTKLRVARVLTESGVDVEFAGANVVDATAFFRDNPLPGGSGVITILLQNPTDSELHVHVNARW